MIVLYDLAYRNLLVKINRTTYAVNILINAVITY